MAFTRIKFIAFILLVATIFAGCGDKNKNNNTANATPENNPVAVDGQVLSSDEEQRLFEEKLMFIVADADFKFYNGLTNEAVAVLSSAVNDPYYANGKAVLLRALIRTELSAGMIESASMRMLQIYNDDTALSDDLSGIIYRYYFDNGKNKEAAEWTEQILALNTISPTVRNKMREWNFISYITLDDSQKVISLAGRIAVDMPAGSAIRILRHGTDMLFTEKRYDLLTKVLQELNRSLFSDIEMNNFISTLRLRLCAAQGDWADYNKLFLSGTQNCSDSELVYVLRKTIPLAMKNRKYAVADNVTAGIITNGNFRKMSYEYSARQWVEIAKLSSPDMVPERIEILVNRNRQIDHIASIFILHAYDNVDDQRFVDEMKPIGEHLIPLTANEDLRASIKTIVLDYSFVIRDYDSAIKILEDGIRGNDKIWHDMAISKVKAHKALEENRPLDAIKEFRAFMAVLQSSEDNDIEEDPATGIIHTREMILGRNAKRIGDIYASIPDTNQAAAAYKEARDYYNKALTTPLDKETAELIKEELAAVPGK